MVLFITFFFKAKVTLWCLLKMLWNPKPHPELCIASLGGTQELAFLEALLAVLNQGPRDPWTLDQHCKKLFDLLLILGMVSLFPILCYT